MTSSLRERRRQLLREEILDAAHQLLTEKSYAAMSMEELAARVGVSKPTLYNQFPTKQALVAAMALQLIEQVIIDLEQSAGARSPLERLLQLLHTTVFMQVERGAMLMQLWMPEIVEILESQPQLRGLILRLDATVLGLLREAIAAGEVGANLDIAAAARIFYALICSPNVGRLSAVPHADPAIMADTATQVFRRGLAPP